MYSIYPSISTCCLKTLLLLNWLHLYLFFAIKLHIYRALTCLCCDSLNGSPAGTDLGCRQRAPDVEIWWFWKCRAECGWFWPVAGDCCCWAAVLFTELPMIGIGWLAEWDALGLKCNVGLVLRTFMSKWWEPLCPFDLKRQLLIPLLWVLILCWLSGAGLETLSWGKVLVEEWVLIAGAQLVSPTGGGWWWWWSIELGCCWFAAICFSCSAWDISGQQGMALGCPAWVLAFCDVVVEEVLVNVKEGPADAGRSCGEPLWTCPKSGECSVLMGFSIGEHRLAAAPAEFGRPRSKPNVSSCFSIFSNSRSFSGGTDFVSSSNRSWRSGSIWTLLSSLKSKIISVFGWPQDWTSVGSFFISFRVMLNMSDPTPCGIM